MLDIPLYFCFGLICLFDLFVVIRTIQVVLEILDQKWVLKMKLADVTAFYGEVTSDDIAFAKYFVYEFNGFFNSAEDMEKKLAKKMTKYPELKTGYARYLKMRA